MSELCIMYLAAIYSTHSQMSFCIVDLVRTLQRKLPRQFLPGIGRLHEMTARASESEETTKAVRYPPGKQQSAITGIVDPVKRCTACQSNTQ